MSKFNIMSGQSMSSLSIIGDGDADVVSWHDELDEQPAEQLPTPRNQTVMTTLHWGRLKEVLERSKSAIMPLRAPTALVVKWNSMMIDIGSVDTAQHTSGAIKFNISRERTMRYYDVLSECQGFSHGRSVIIGLDEDNEFYGTVCSISMRGLINPKIVLEIGGIVYRSQLECGETVILPDTCNCPFRI